MPKGLRRLEQLCQGDFGGSTGLVRTLHLALEVPADEVKAAVEETQLLACHVSAAQRGALLIRKLGADSVNLIGGRGVPFPGAAAIGPLFEEEALSAVWRGQANHLAATHGQRWPYGSD